MLAQQPKTMRPGLLAMKDTLRNPRALRLEPLCKDGAVLQGSLPLSGLPRLAEGFSAASDGSAQWSLKCSNKPVAGGAAELWVHVLANAVVPLQCQRCLGPMAQPLNVDRAIRFVHGEDLAARLDEETEDDVLSLPAALDVQSLIEDELILAQPLVPRHEGACPQPLWAGAGPEQPAEAEAAEQEPHPFAALAALKRKGHPP
jgi:uncharacterized protein